MWKDFFYFSKGQRIAIIALITLIFIVILLNHFLPVFFSSKITADTKFLSEVAAFNKQLATEDSIEKANSEKNSYQYHSVYTKSEAKAKLKSFDPNLADSLTFSKLGLPVYVIKNILKFRAKGGTFKTVESFSRIYGLSPEKFNTLKPYIRIVQAQEKIIKTDTITKKVIPVAQPVMVELNGADTTELMKVKGIGRGYAKGIVGFRKALGGYVSVSQLHEVYGMTDENFEKIKTQCWVNTMLVRKIDVNYATIAKLKRHPYISFFQAKAIYQLRRKKGELKSIDELRKLKEFSSEQLDKIRPYLNFKK